MPYEGRIYRPPSEADSLILQATIGCSWNKCVYCDMYRDKEFRVRPLEETLAHITAAGRFHRKQVRKVFIADGDALVLDLEHWIRILDACREAFPDLRRVSSYAWAQNVLEKSQEDLATLREHGLSLVYIGPESGDEVTLKRLGKGATFDDHVKAADRLRAAGIEQSVIFLLGAGGTARSVEHARASARLATVMDPKFLSALTLTVVPGTPIARAQQKGIYELPQVAELLAELRTFVAEASPTDAIFRTNHASNYLPVQGRLPRDRDAIVRVLDDALSGRIALRSEWMRGL
ncbi:MAG: radical SAM protein [Planctomycetes bacterium]|nr:radical SAM protein [Planctomycetota bacterium]MCB9891114.1 radical SAM protein [Planctomycetota bacterium]MCB9918882.1 radical SAM protein [Planctomycetota bacterium]